MLWCLLRAACAVRGQGRTCLQSWSASAFCLQAAVLWASRGTCIHMHRQHSAPSLLSLHQVHTLCGLICLLSWSRDGFEIKTPEIQGPESCVSLPGVSLGSEQYLRLGSRLSGDRHWALECCDPQPLLLISCVTWMNQSLPQPLSSSVKEGRVMSLWAGLSHGWLVDGHSTVTASIALC